MKITKDLEEELMRRIKADMCIIKYCRGAHYYECHFCGKQDEELRFLFHNTSCFGKRFLDAMKPEEPKNILDQWLNNESE
jgi:hypothetical protein